MLSSLASQLPSVSSSISSPAATSTAITESAKQLAWQAALYLVIALVVTAVISGTILLMWNHDWTALILRRLKLESVRSVSTLVQWMLCYFFTTLFPAFQRLRRTAAAPRRQSVLPLFRHPRLQQPLLAEPPLALLRRSSSRVPPNSYSPEPSTLPSSSIFLYSAGPAP